MNTVVKHLIESYIDELERNEFGNIIMRCPHDDLPDLLDALLDADLSPSSRFQPYVNLVSYFAKQYGGGVTHEIRVEDNFEEYTFKFRHAKFRWKEIEEDLVLLFPKHDVQVAVDTSFNGGYIEAYVKVRLHNYPSPLIPFLDY